MNGGRKVERFHASGLGVSVRVWPLLGHHEGSIESVSSEGNGCMYKIFLLVILQKTEYDKAEPNATK